MYTIVYTKYIWTQVFLLTNTCINYFKYIRQDWKYTLTNSNASYNKKANPVWLDLFTDIQYRFQVHNKD